MRRWSLVMEIDKSMKLQDEDGSVNTHLRPCHSCIRCLKLVQRISFCWGQGCGSQMPKMSSMNLL